METSLWLIGMRASFLFLCFVVFWLRVTSCLYVGGEGEGWTFGTRREKTESIYRFSLLNRHCDIAQVANEVQKSTQDDEFQPVGTSS